MEQENPYQAPTTPIPLGPNPEDHTQPSTSVREVVRDAWKNLFRSKERHLLDIYNDAIAAIEPQATRLTSVDEARGRWIQHAIEPILSDQERFDLEHRSVLAIRITAAWNFFWLAILPGSVAVCLLIYAWRNLKLPPVPQRMIIIAILSLVTYKFILPFILIFSMLLQALFLKPFYALIGRITGLAAPDLSGPKQGEPGKPA